MAALDGRHPLEESGLKVSPVSGDTTRRISLSKQDVDLTVSQLGGCFVGIGPESEFPFGESFLTEPKPVAIIKEQFH